MISKNETLVERVAFGDRPLRNETVTVNERTMGRTAKILAIASEGHHWVELLRLRPAFENLAVIYVTTHAKYESMVEGAPFRAVIEATRDTKVRTLVLFLQVLWIVLRDRPTVIVTTGASPGYLAIRIGKWFGLKTLWIDSMAESEGLSPLCRLASKHANSTLTQWRHLEVSGTVDYRGSVVSSNS